MKPLYKSENTVKKIIDFATLLNEESEKQIKEYNDFNNYIEPLFFEKFGHNYESSLSSIYQGERRDFLNFHKAEIKAIKKRPKNYTKKHEKLRMILIEYGCKEFGDCIIDEISEVFNAKLTPII